MKRYQIIVIKNDGTEILRAIRYSEQGAISYVAMLIEQGMNAYYKQI